VAGCIVNLSGKDGRIKSVILMNKLSEITEGMGCQHLSIYGKLRAKIDKICYIRLDKKIYNINPKHCNYKINDMMDDIEQLAYWRLSMVLNSLRWNGNERDKTTWII